MEDAIENGAVSLGGLTVGLGIIVWIVIRWWNQAGGKGIGDKIRRNWRALAFPFVPLMFYGMLLILSTGGILGGASNFALWGQNQIGRVVLEYGVGGNDTDATRATSLVLENGGHAVVVLMTVAFIATWMFNKSIRRWDLILPILAGISLGLSDGVAGWAARVLAPAVDSLGGFISGIL